MESTQLLTQIDYDDVDQMDLALGTQICYHLEIRSSPEPLFLDLARGCSTLGREKGSVVIHLDSPSVSRVHAQIVLEPDGLLTIEDLGSANKTWKNSHRLTPHIRYSLKGNEVLKFGDVRVHLHEGSCPPVVDEEEGLSRSPILVPETPIAPKRGLFHGGINNISFVPASQSSPFTRVNESSHMKGDSDSDSDESIVLATQEGVPSLDRLEEDLRVLNEETQNLLPHKEIIPCSDESDIEMTPPPPPGSSNKTGNESGLFLLPTQNLIEEEDSIKSSKRGDPLINLRFHHQKPSDEMLINASEAFSQDARSTILGNTQYPLSQDLNESNESEPVLLSTQELLKDTTSALEEGESFGSLCEASSNMEDSRFCDGRSVLKAKDNGTSQRDESKSSIKESALYSCEAVKRNTSCSKAPECSDRTDKPSETNDLSSKDESSKKELSGCDDVKGDASRSKTPKRSQRTHHDERSSQTNEFSSSMEEVLSSEIPLGEQIRLSNRDFEDRSRNQASQLEEPGLLERGCQGDMREKAIILRNELPECSDGKGISLKSASCVNLLNASNGGKNASEYLADSVVPQSGDKRNDVTDKTQRGDALLESFENGDINRVPPHKFPSNNSSLQVDVPFKCVDDDIVSPHNDSALLLKRHDSPDHESKESGDNKTDEPSPCDKLRSCSNNPKNMSHVDIHPVLTPLNLKPHRVTKKSEESFKFLVSFVTHTTTTVANSNTTPTHEAEQKASKSGALSTEIVFYSKPLNLMDPDMRYLSTSLLSHAVVRPYSLSKDDENIKEPQPTEIKSPADCIPNVPQIEVGVLSEPKRKKRFSLVTDSEESPQNKRSKRTQPSDTAPPPPSRRSSRLRKPSSLYPKENAKRRGPLKVKAEEKEDEPKVKVPRKSLQTPLVERKSARNASAKASGNKSPRLEGKETLKTSRKNNSFHAKPSPIEKKKKVPVSIINPKDIKKDPDCALPESSPRGNNSSTQRKTKKSTRNSRASASIQLETPASERRSKRLTSTIPTAAPTERCEEAMKPSSKKRMGKKTSSMAVSIKVELQDEESLPSKEEEEESQFSDRTLGSSWDDSGLNTSGGRTGGRARFSRPVVLFTGFDDIKGDSKIVRDLGGSLTEDASKCNLAVMDSLRRTVKLVSVVAKGIPIVDRSYLRLSKEAKTFLNPWKYLIHDDDFQKNYSCILRFTLRHAQKKGLLSGFEVHITKSSEPSPSQFKSIVECSGGTYLKDLRKRTAETDGVIVVSCPQDSGLYRKYIASGYIVVSKEFLLTGILKHEMDFKTFALR